MLQPQPFGRRARPRGSGLKDQIGSYMCRETGRSGYSSQYLGQDTSLCSKEAQHAAGESNPCLSNEKVRKFDSGRGENGEGIKGEHPEIAALINEAVLT